MSARQNWKARSVDTGEWSAICEQLSIGRWKLAGLWGDGARVRMALRNDEEIELVSLDCPDGNYPSVAQLHPPAQRLERMIADLNGLVASDSPDRRGWLDHGNWPIKHPLGDPEANPAGNTGAPGEGEESYAFLPAEGEGLNQIAVGPIHAGIIEPGHFRFTANGETIVRLEERFGYAHKGVEALLAGASIEEGARLAGRVSGDSTVAYSIGYARAVEEASGTTVPERADYLRALMAELERLANHLGDIGAVCNDAGFALMQAHCSVLREKVLRCSARCFGHRLMMDCVVPGGSAVDVDSAKLADLRDLATRIETRLPRLIDLYDQTASLQDRTAGAGVLSEGLARQYGCGGFVGRASARDFDARRNFAYAPYDRLLFAVPVLDAGDVNARIRVRIREVEQSLALVRQILDQMPQGECRTGIKSVGTSGGSSGGASGEGLALIEGFRGDILCSVRLDEHGRIARCHLRDPSWFQWPLLEAVIENNIVADFPLCNKSFNCSYSGHDL